LVDEGDSMATTAYFGFAPGCSCTSNWLPPAQGHTPTFFGWSGFEMSMTTIPSP
jgi:hypothetical protein